jgi:hypothetical protein
MVLTMLGIGVAMAASLANYHRLVSIHRPLRILILITVAQGLVEYPFAARMVALAAVAPCPS